jgi:hypothetical protein
MDAFQLLHSMRDADEAVALIIADQWMPEETGSAFLARTRDLRPTAQRLLVAAWADFGANKSIVQAPQRFVVVGHDDAWHLRRWRRAPWFGQADRRRGGGRARPPSARSTSIVRRRQAARPRPGMIGFGRSTPAKADRPVKQREEPQ